MSDPTPRTGTTAYGRACNNCAKAKCKCIPSSNSQGQGPCERCLRLRKDCQPAPSVRKKPGRKPVSKTAQLQDKLDDLVTLLRSAAATNGTSADALLQQARSLSQASAGSQGDESNSPTEPRHTSSTSCFSPLPQPDRPPPNYIPSPISVGTLHQPDNDNDYGVSPQEAEECLHMFRTQKLRYLHFVSLPESVTAAQLREEKPFLWLSIMISCNRNISQQQILGEKFRALIAQKVVVEHQRSLDILQGLVGFLGWSTYHFRLIGKPFMTMYCHLMAAMVQELYIDKPTLKPNDSPHPMACMKMHGFIAKTLPSPVRTTQECRAVLASWLISANVGTFTRRSFALSWTSHMDDCLKMLDEHPDSPWDAVLTQQVRLQRVAEGAPCHSLPNAPLEGTVQTKAFWDFQTKALLLKLDETRKNGPKDIPEDMSFLWRLHEIATELELLEVNLYSTQSKPDSTTDSPNMPRITSLTRILNLTKEWFSILLQQPASQFFMFAFPLTAQISYLTIIMYRLSTLDDPYWDKALVQQTLDPFGILDEMSGKFAQIPAACGIVCEKPELDTWGACTRAIRHLKSIWEPVFLRAIGGQGQVLGQGSLGAGGSEPGRGVATCNRVDESTTAVGGNNIGGDGLGPGVGGSNVQGHMPQMTGSDPMDTSGAGYDPSWENYNFDLVDMTNGWIADMFSGGWD